MYNMRVKLIFGVKSRSRNRDRSHLKGQFVCHYPPIYKIWSIYSSFIRSGVRRGPIFKKLVTWPWLRPLSEPSNVEICRSCFLCPNCQILCFENVVWL